jgi:hypothetical protein
MLVRGVNTDRKLKLALAVVGTVALTAAVWPLFAMSGLSVSVAGIGFVKPYYSRWFYVCYSDVPGYLTILFCILSITTSVVLLFRRPSRKVVIWSFLLGLSPILVGLLSNIGILFVVAYADYDVPFEKHGLYFGTAIMLLRIAVYRVLVGIAGSVISLTLLTFAFLRTGQKTDMERHITSGGLRVIFLVNILVVTAVLLVRMIFLMLPRSGNADFSSYPMTWTFRDYLSFHNTRHPWHLEHTNLLAISAFPLGEYYALQYMVAESGKKHDWLYAPYRGYRGGGAKQLPEADMKALRVAIAELPHKSVSPPIERLVIVSFRDGRNWVTRSYDSDALPKPMRQIYDIIGEWPESKQRPDKHEIDLVRRHYSRWYYVCLSDVPGHLTVLFGILSITTSVVLLFRPQSREVVIWSFLLGLSPMIVGLLSNILISFIVAYFSYPGAVFSGRTPNILCFTTCPIEEPEAIIFLRTSACRACVGIAGSVISLTLLAFAFLRTRQKANDTVEPTRAVSGASVSPSP